MSIGKPYCRKPTPPEKPKNRKPAQNSAIPCICNLVQFLRTSGQLTLHMPEKQMDPLTMVCRKDVALLWRAGCHKDIFYSFHCIPCEFQLHNTNNSDIADFASSCSQRRTHIRGGFHKAGNGGTHYSRNNLYPGVWATGGQLSPCVQGNELSSPSWSLTARLSFCLQPR